MLIQCVQKRDSKKGREVDMSFLNSKAKYAINVGPSIRKGSYMASTGEQDKGDTTPFEDMHGFTGKTPVSKDGLYNELAQRIGADITDLNIMHMTGSPRNAIHYGHIEGYATANGKTYKFVFYFTKDGKVDDKLSEVGRIQIKAEEYTKKHME